MIAADTSTMVAFLEGAEGDDVDLVQSAIDHQQLVLPPVVLTELLSDPALPDKVRVLLKEIRSSISSRATGIGRVSSRRDPAPQAKARVADALIAQSCLDQATPLVTRDRDFRHFAQAAGLNLF